MGIEFSFSSNSASRHVGAALINLDEILRESGFLHVLGKKNNHAANVFVHQNWLVTHLKQLGSANK